VSTPAPIANCTLIICATPILRDSRGVASTTSWTGPARGVTGAAQPESPEWMPASDVLHDAIDGEFHAVRERMSIPTASSVNVDEGANSSGPTMLWRSDPLEIVGEPMGRRRFHAATAEHVRRAQDRG
jgi:hypothetical protein